MNIILPKIHPVYLDYETYYDKECSVKTLGPRAYVEHPKFDAYLVSIIAGSDEWVGNPRDFDSWSDLEGMQPVAHNAMFDWEVFLWCVRQGFHPDLFADRASWHCTAALAAFIGAPRALAGAVKQLYNHTLDKGMRSWMDGKTWADAVAAGKAERLSEYGMEDTRWGNKIYQDHQHTMPDWEVLLMEHTLRSGVIGCPVDVKYINQSSKKLLGVIKDTEDHLPWVEEGDKPTSPKGLARACRAMSIEPPTSTAEDSDAFEMWAAENPEIDFVRDMQKWRKANRMKKLLETLKARTVDGVFNYSIKFYGAHTGRWSGDGGFNMHNLPRVPIADVDLRGCFIAGPGHKLVCADLAQIEARVLIWLAGDEVQMEMIRQGYNVYESHAKATMGWKGKPGTMKKEFPELYQLAKARVLGLGFGCGWKKFIQAAWVMAQVRVTAQQSKQTVNAYRATNKKITDSRTGFWAMLNSDFVRSCNPKLNPSGVHEIELPSGRMLRYFNCINKGGRYMAQHVMGSPHVDFYGGKLAENVVQATARDILGEAVLRIERECKVPVLFTVHDEAVSRVPKKYDSKKIYTAMCTPPPWAPDLPVGCELVESERYVK